MKILIITDTFPPLKGSGAIQFKDLVIEFSRQGHDLTVVVPRPDLKNNFISDKKYGANLLLLKSLPTKDVGIVRRTLNEFLLPYFMIRGIKASKTCLASWDAVIWHSPTIFWGPMISKIKRKSQCRTYLIIRDIFPNWAVDLELIRRGSVIYFIFDAIARYQYSVADIIGVQSSGNQIYFDRWQQKPGRKLEILQNWLDKAEQVRCSVRVDQTPLAGRKVFVYAGNMGIAQGMDILLDLAKKLRCRPDVGFLIVGRGSESARLKEFAKVRQLDNVVLLDEIIPDEIPDLYAQCHAGIVALDPRHKSHNIPGKFLTYMRSGLPVLANINAGNDLAQMIRDERVGQVCETNQVDELLLLTEKLLDQIQSDSGLSARCTALFEREFAVQNTVKQIVAALSATEAGPP